MLQAITLCLKGSSKSKLVAMFHIMDTDGDGEGFLSVTSPAGVAAPPPSRRVYCASLRLS